MPSKQKLLDALDCTLEDLSEDRLLDLLLDAYAAKKKKIEELRSENAREAQALHDQREVLDKEYQRMRRDPTIWLASQYFFRTQTALLVVNIRGPEISICERKKGIDYAAEQLSVFDAEKIR
jgi:hypothetical protein